MKSITIAGRVGKDAENRQTQGGDNVTGFTVAVDDGYGQNKSTLWFDVSFWGKRGAAVSQYLKKGAQVTVTGDLGTREYNGKTYLTIRANDLTLQGGNRDGQSGGYSGGQSEGYNAGGRPSGDDDLGDDIPWGKEWRA
jgi:single-strand DNA-binding protein